MNTLEIENLQRKLDVFLKELASSPQVINDSEKRKKYYLRIEEMYKKDTRHSYSGIFSTLSAIHKGEELGDLETLQQNLLYLYKHYQPKLNQDDSGNLIDVGNNLFKLYDHVQLEIERIHYSDGGDNRISLAQSYKDVQQEIDTAKLSMREQTIQIQDQQKKIKKLKNNLKSFNAQSITILGIFSGLVIGFATATDVLVAAFANLPTVGILDMSIFLILTGFVLFNVIFLLMQCIGRLTGQSLFAVKKLKRRREDTTSILADCDQKKPSGISLIIFYNVVSLLLIVVLYIVRICLYVIDYMPAPMFIR